MGFSYLGNRRNAGFPFFYALYLIYNYLALDFTSFRKGTAYMPLENPKRQFYRLWLYLILCCPKGEIRRSQCCFRLQKYNTDN